MSECDAKSESAQEQEQSHTRIVQGGINEGQGGTGYTDNNSNSKQKEFTRTYIAIGYIVGFFIVILLVFITGWVKNFNINDYKDLLITVSGVLSGSLGFIVGYYFKASKE